MKRQGLSFAARLNAWFAAIVILLSVALFLIAYLLLYRAVRERDREVVRAQRIPCAISHHLRLGCAACLAPRHRRRCLARAAHACADSPAHWRCRKRHRYRTDE